MHAALTRHLPAVRDLCRRYGVTRLEVFGSAARGDDFDPARSDADFLVEFEVVPGLPPLKQYFGLADALREALGRAVDLVEAGAVSNPYFKAEIERAKELIYAA
jgi:hypothetical protein